MHFHQHLIHPSVGFSITRLSAKYGYKNSFVYGVERDNLIHPLAFIISSIHLKVNSLTSASYICQAAIVSIYAVEDAINSSHSVIHLLRSFIHSFIQLVNLSESESVSQSSVRFFFFPSFCTSQTPPSVPCPTSYIESSFICKSTHSNAWNVFTNCLMNN